ncbi:hypothetical protein FRIGORI9N_280015 [Frigoribacterium sp. 9N]|nr:hypothetical protein FRIGORI9N_280015 [Frigoribacterium sp. 9N]
MRGGIATGGYQVTRYCKEAAYCPIAPILAA